MLDQADRLRALVREAAVGGLSAATPAPYKLVVAGSKGGVGATTVALELSVTLARQGSRTVLVDADLNRPDLAALCGLDPSDTIADVLSGRRTVHETLHRGPGGVQILPAAWSSNTVPDCSPPAQQRLLGELDRLGRHADVIVLDIGCGLNHVIRRYWNTADEVLLVTTTDNVALLDAYAAIKVLAAGRDDLPIKTLVNLANADSAAGVHVRIAHAARKFLDREIEHAGHVPHIGRDRASQSGAVDFDANPLAKETIERITEELLADCRRRAEQGGGAALELAVA